MADRDRLAGIIDSFFGVDSAYFGVDKYEFADHLLENGIIVPPCKVGQTVYTSFNHLLNKETNEISECKVAFIGFCKDGNYINLVDNYEHLHSMDFETFRKTVFFTKEEIEEILKEKITK